ncbi:FixH family protein [Halomonas denitrificans]|nr:FixH family protein [Halomonas denitrificans]
MSSETPTARSAESSPWYRQFWPWFILAILGWGVVSASITLAVAVRNPPHMMTGDYARLGKALVDTHQRADRAAALGLVGELTLAAGEVAVSLPAEGAAALGDSLLLLVQHPTDAARDLQVVLRRAGEVRYAAPARDWPARGRLIVSNLDQDWWISSDYRLAGDELAVRLEPERL